MHTYTDLFYAKDKDRESFRRSKKKGRIMSKEYIIEVENPETDTLEAITEALNAFNIRCYIYEKGESNDNN